MSVLQRRPRRYPRWPERDEAAEYYETPPEHFLAQAGPSRHPFALRSQDIELHVAQHGTHAANESDGCDPWAAETFNTQEDRRQYMPDTSTLAAADFDVDVRTGFLPPEPPVARLTECIYEVWEELLDAAKRVPLRLHGEGTAEERILARRWRQQLREMPELPIQPWLHGDIRHARRAHLVLSFLAHFYLHSQPVEVQAAASPGRWWTPSNLWQTKNAATQQDRELEEKERAGSYLDEIPVCIARPWVQLSRTLGLPPILTYATTVLWNWALIDEAKPISISNVRILETFTGTKSEEHFFLTSLLIEIRGVEALTLMRQSLDEIFVGDELGARRFTSYLNRLALVIADLTKLLAQVRDHCVPTEFYFDIRPWFRGGDAALNGRGWHYQGVDAPLVRRQLGGPSAGQSSLIHALDVFLDVDHTRSKERLRERKTRPGSMPASDATFMERMAFYMPKHHRHFLMHLKSLSFDDEDESIKAAESACNPSEAREAAAASSPSSAQHPVRAYVLSRRDTDHDLVAAYDATLVALKALRDEHMRIAALYIISQARKAKAAMPSQPGTALEQAGAKEPEFRGTGGTDLVLFLRDCRTNTTDAMVGDV